MISCPTVMLMTLWSCTMWVDAETWHADAPELLVRNRSSTAWWSSEGDSHVGSLGSRGCRTRRAAFMDSHAERRASAADVTEVSEYPTRGDRDALKSPPQRMCWTLGPHS